ncbi:alpha/beta hydrolase [Flagellimonas sp. HMM57]|uniref:alpha/beta fold hydrolase n=1 Tax=unclassified Flagellimonas TaxID=2644544 RepID=UPI0013D5D18B|nr:MULTISPECIES: alpha/beta hydrolase [unclassified Flagellimonas]UII75887.1 alpha/beta hydrolase [Flagellimonas sp. HMM57]
MDSTAQNAEFIRNGAHTLSLKAYSNRASETIMLLHGGPGVPDDMLEIVEVLKNDFRVITFEQRGVGQSVCNACGYAMEDYISDIDAISENLKIDRFHLFGHSWGGLYAQIYAEARPKKIRSLFLCSPSSGTNETWKKTEKEVMEFNKKSTSKKEWIQMGWNSVLGMLGSDSAYQKLFKQVLKNYHSAYGEVKIEEAFFNKIHAEPINKTTKEIVNYRPLSIFNNPNYPILITYGKTDIYGNSKNELLKRFPTAKVELIEKSGHIPWKHNPTEFNRIVNEFYLA